MAPSPASLARAPEGHSVRYVMGLIMLAVALVGLAGAYGLKALVHIEGQPAAGEKTLSRTLLGKTLVIPASWFRDDADQRQGFSSEVDLRLLLPLKTGGGDVPVDVTLLPLSQVKPSANLLDGVYLHQFMPNELAGPPGLVGKPLYGTEGYDGETVWYDALSQNPFVAKCSAAPDGHGPAQCLRTVALSNGMAAVYGFGADILDRWKDFDPTIKVVLSQIGAL